MPGGFPLGLELCNAQDIGTVIGSTDGTTITASGSTNTKGSYSQLIASTSFDSCWALVQLIIGGLSTRDALVDIAVGAAASEVVVASNLVVNAGANLSSEDYSYSFPLIIPSGSRVAARCQSATASETVTVRITLFDGAFTQIEGCAGVDMVGANTSTSKGTPTTPSATTDTKGSYAQLIASTARDYMGFIPTVNAGTGGLNYMFDIAIGGAGSEQVIVPNSIYQAGGATHISGEVYPLITIPIPSGTRVAARCQAHGTSSAAINISLASIYQ